MTHKTAPRARLYASTSLFPMLRGPQVFYAPDQEGGETVDDTPEEYREQPGDREPDHEGEPDPEPVEASEAEEEPDPEPEPEAAETEEEPEPTPAQKKDWRDRQIAKLREREKAREAELAEIKRRAEAAEALLAADAESRQGGLADQERERIRKEEAEKVRIEADAQRINKGLEDMDAAGKAAFGESWDEQVRQAAELFGRDLAARPDVLDALTELPNSAAVYHELTADLDKLEGLLKLPAYKMGAELARLSDKLAAPRVKPVSKAPKPIRPISTEGVERDLESLINDPKASMDEIDRRMRAEEAKRAKAH